MKHTKRFFYICLTFLFLVLFSSTQLLNVYAETILPTDVQTTVDAEQSLLSTSSYTDRHSYDMGVYDGATYFIKNVKTGRYLDVDHGSTDSGTNVLAWSYHGETNQKFKFSYLGMGLYEIVPYNSPTVILHAASSAENANIEIRTKSRTTTNQKFKLRMLDYNKAIIYTQVSGFTQALYYDGSGDNNVFQKNYASLSSSNKEYAQWELSCVSAYSYHSYSKYYIRNLNTGLYLEVANKSTTSGGSIHAKPFVGGENQQWKRVFDYDTSAYYFKPMHRTDMAMDMYQTNAVIFSDTYPTDQGLRLEWVNVPDELEAYRITTAKSGYTKYLNMGVMTGTDPDCRYVTSGTDSNDLWIFEAVPYDYAGADRLYVNQTYEKTIESYGEAQSYTFKTDVASRFKVELVRQNGNAIMSVFYGNGAQQPAFNHVYNLSNGQAFDVFLKANTIYYVYIFDSDDNLDSRYTIRVRQFVATYHSHDFPNDINRILDSSADMNLKYVHKNNMTVARAKTECDELTGKRDFNSEIFVYSGHGYNGYACYDGSSIFNYFGASELPSMSNCELAVWDCCQSSKKYLIRSLVSESIEKGAKTVIGWYESIPAIAAEDYMDRLFEQLALGKTVKQASDASIVQNHFASTDVIVSSITIAGNNDNIIFPINEYSYEINQQSALAYNQSGYMLVNENMEYGAKVYSKLINGIPTDDFYVEFYNHGELTSVYKSPYFLTAETMSAVLESQPQASVLYYSSDSIQNNLSYADIDGNLTLIQRREILTEANGVTFVNVKFYNMETGLEVVL